VQWSLYTLQLQQLHHQVVCISTAGVKIDFWAISFCVCLRLMGCHIWGWPSFSKGPIHLRRVITMYIFGPSLVNWMYGGSYWHRSIQTYCWLIHRILLKMSNWDTHYDKIEMSYFIENNLEVIKVILHKWWKGWWVDDREVKKLDERAKSELSKNKIYNGRHEGHEILKITDSKRLGIWSERIRSLSAKVKIEGLM
jgi:hypothetical protein